MHSVTCPSCGGRVEVDFIAVAGQAWCPKCQKLFSPSVEPPKEVKDCDGRNGEVD
jgi:hypothetical protein